MDFLSTGKPLVYKKTLEERKANRARPFGNTNGSGNSGKSKSEEHRRKIADAIKAKHKQGKYDSVELGRKKKLT